MDSRPCSTRSRTHVAVNDFEIDAIWDAVSLVNGTPAPSSP
jgi:hypothetical protein